MHYEDPETPELKDQAERVEQIIPMIARRLFVIDPAHPLAEMPIAQLRLCSLLRSQESPTMSQVAEELRISVSAVTQLADRLERSGMVERVSGASTSGGERDRRARHLRLTERGRELMQSRSDLRQRGARMALSHLSPDDRKRVLEALETLLTAGIQTSSEEVLQSDVVTRENIAHMEWRGSSGSETNGGTETAPDTTGAA